MPNPPILPLHECQPHRARTPRPRAHPQRKPFSLAVPIGLRTLGASILVLLTACSASEVTTLPKSPPYKSLNVGGSLLAPDWERLQKIGCISLGDSAMIGAIGLPVSATKFAHYDCRGVSKDSLIGAIKAIVSDAMGADGSASLMSSGFWFLIDQQYDPTCSATTYRDGGFYNGSGAYVLDTIGTGCTRRTYLWVPGHEGDEGDPGTIPDGGDGGGGGGGGGDHPPSVSNPDSVAIEELFEPSCFASENKAKPTHCLKKFSATTLGVLRKTANYLRDLDDIADPVARAECALVRGYFNTMMATDTLIFRGAHDSPKRNPDGSIKVDEFGNPVFYHYATTIYPDSTAGTYGKAHADPYWIKGLMTADSTSLDAGKAFRFTLRYLMHEAVHVITRARHPEVSDEDENPVYTSPLFKTIESRDPTKSCILPGTDIFLP